MDVRITNRRGTVSPAMREYAEKRAGKLAKFEPRLLSVELLFDEDHGRVSVEGRAEVPGVPTLVARSEGTARKTEFDRMLQKLQRQLRRERSKRVEHQGPPAATLAD